MRNVCNLFYSLLERGARAFLCFATARNVQGKGWRQ